MLRHPRLLFAIVVLNLILAITTLAWLAWIAVEPERWFAGAYAEQGPPGEKGPRGARGPTGPPGPVGPDAEGAIGDLRSDLDELADQVSVLEAEVSDIGAGLSSTELQGRWTRGARRTGAKPIGRSREVKRDLDSLELRSRGPNRHAMATAEHTRRTACLRWGQYASSPP